MCKVEGLPGQGKCLLGRCVQRRHPACLPGAKIRDVGKMFVQSRDVEFVKDVCKKDGVGERKVCQAHGTLR